MNCWHINHIKTCFACFCVMFGILQATAQQCESKAFSVTYKASETHTIFKSVSNDDNTVITIGAIGSGNQSNAWISKRSAQGNIIWTQVYTPVAEANEKGTLSNLQFNNIAKASSSTYIITGFVIRHGVETNGVENPPPVNCGIFICIDQSGNVLWSYKFIDKYSLAQDGPNVNCVKALQLQNGNFLLYLQEETSSSRPDTKLLCLSASGVLQWKLNLHFPDFIYTQFNEYAELQMIQLKNGNIVVADNLEREHAIDEAGGLLLHLFSLKPNDGSIVWEKGFEIPILVNTGFTFINNWALKNVCELPNGGLSIIAYTNLFENSTQPFEQPNIINVITDNTGNIRKTIAYVLPGYYLYPIKAISQGVDGKQALMCTTPQRGVGEFGDNFISYQHPAILTINAEGHIISQNRYDPISSTSQSYVFINNFTNRYSGGYYLFYYEQGNQNDNFRFISSKAIITDDAGAIDCARSDASIMEKEVEWYRRENTGFLRVDAPENYTVFMLPLTIQKHPFSLSKTIDCESNAICCPEIIDTLHTKNIVLCEGSSYKLPDERMAYKDGFYDILSKTPSGCDSFSFYNIRFEKRPPDLLPVSDTCLGDEETISLLAAEGYSTYNWNGTFIDTPAYTISKEGAYVVAVQNACGISKDTVTVYKSCELHIQMPSAFTPNGDGLNDLYRIPPKDATHLVGMQIYNRFGSLVFATRNASAGWNGMYKNIAQPSASVYVYRLLAKDLKNRIFEQKGTFVLIR